MSEPRADGLRSLMRRAVRPLPDGAQLLVKQVRATVRGDDWAPRIARLRARERPALDAIVAQSRRLPDRKHIMLFALQQVPPWLDVEYALAAALGLRGHRVDGILCDGMLPVCEMSLGPVERPPCTVCSGWLARYEHAFGFEFSRLTGFLTADDVEAAREFGEAAFESRTSPVIDGVAVGRYVHREIQRYYRGFVFDVWSDSRFRDWLIAARLLVSLAARMLDQVRPDIIIAGSGRTLPSACLLAVAQQRCIRTVTWDCEASFDDALVFSHERPAVEIPLDAAWSDAARPITDAERGRLHEFLRRWAASENTPFPYNAKPLDDGGAVAAALGLRGDAPMVAAFTNSAWDMAVVDRDVGFANMFDWVFALVDYARAHPEIDLVVRAHPAEANVPPDLQSRTPVAAIVRSRYASLPANVKLVDGSSRISSYSLAQLARVMTVYASRIGLELAIRGRRPWVAGDVTYRGKGFTFDLESRQQMVDALAGGCFDDALSAREIELAERFGYLWFFRYATRAPSLRAPDGRFAMRSFLDLAPGRDSLIDRLCDALVSGAPFLDLTG